MPITDITVMTFIDPKAQRCQSKAPGSLDNVRHSHPSGGRM
jgi:hypothetical protein